MSVEEWLGEAPAEVTKTTERLLEEVAGMREDGQTIYPPQDDILNALAWTAPGDVRAVILGQDPYHEEGQAMGLSFSVHEGCRLPPSRSARSDSAGCPPGRCSTTRRRTPCPAPPGWDHPVHLCAPPRSPSTAPGSCPAPVPPAWYAPAQPCRAVLWPRSTSVHPLSPLPLPPNSDTAAARWRPAGR